MVKIVFIFMLFLLLNACTGKKEWNRPNDGKARLVKGNDGVQTIVFESPTDGVWEIGNGEIWHKPVGGGPVNKTTEFDPIPTDYIEKKMKELTGGSIRVQGDPIGSIRPAGNKSGGGSGSIRPEGASSASSSGSIRPPTTGSIRTDLIGGGTEKSGSIRTAPTAGVPSGSIRTGPTGGTTPAAGSIRIPNTKTAKTKSGSIRPVDLPSHVDVSIRDQKISPAMHKSHMHLKAGRTIRPGDDARDVPVSKSMRPVYELDTSTGTSGGGGNRSIRPIPEGDSGGTDILRIPYGTGGKEPPSEVLRIPNPLVESIRKGVSLLKASWAGESDDQEDTWQKYQTTRDVIDIRYEWEPVLVYIARLCSYMDARQSPTQFRVADFVRYLVDNQVDARLPALWKRLGKIVAREPPQQEADKQQITMFALMGMNQMLRGNMFEAATEQLEQQGLLTKLEGMETNIMDKAIRINRNLDLGSMEPCMQLVFSEMAQTFNLQLLDITATAYNLLETIRMKAAPGKKQKQVALRMDSRKIQPEIADDGDDDGNLQDSDKHIKAGKTMRDRDGNIKF